MLYKYNINKPMLNHYHQCIILNVTTSLKNTDRANCGLKYILINHHYRKIVKIHRLFKKNV
jgi:hypothetical protein